MVQSIHLNARGLWYTCFCLRASTSSQSASYCNDIWVNFVVNDTINFTYYLLALPSHWVSGQRPSLTKVASYLLALRVDAISFRQDFVEELQFLCGMSGKSWLSSPTTWQTFFLASSFLFSKVRKTSMIWEEIAFAIPRWSWATSEMELINAS